jgi:hypothetical protein
MHPRPDRLGPYEQLAAAAAWLRPLAGLDSGSRARDPRALPYDSPHRWQELVSLSSRHLVTPALAWVIKDDPALPPDVRDYFAAIFELTTERNIGIQAALAETIAALNRAGIEPMLLKGAAGLAAALYPHHGARIFGDIDLLIRADRLSEASALLADIGFAPTPQPQWVALAHHHLPMHLHPGRIAGVELHREVLPPGHRALADAAAFFAGARMIDTRGGRALLPSPTDWAAHIIAHGQIIDGGYARGVPQLRQLLDLVMLRARDEARIDWQQLERRFGRARAGAVLRDALGLAELLFDQPPPPGLRTDPAAVAERLRTSLERPRTRLPAVAAGMIASYARQLQARPLTIVNILQPLAWRDRYRRVARQMRRAG